MTQEDNKKFGYPTHCWNCNYPLVVFSYHCVCGADNTPPGQAQPGKGAPKSSAARDALKDELARQREEIRKSLKPK